MSLEPDQTPATWDKGEPPKDGKLYVAIGRAVARDEYGGSSRPFVSKVRWDGDWLDDRGLAIRYDAAERVIIAWHIALPENTEGNER